jgi:hypothetical protein
MPKDIRRILVLVPVTWVLGCSPYVYGPEIKNFREGVTALQSTIADAAVANTANWRDFETLDYSSNNPRARPVLSLSSECADALKQASSTLTQTAQPTIACDLSMVSAGSLPVALNIYPNERAFGRAADILRTIDGYGKALSALTEATSSAELEGAAKQFCAAATAIGAVAGAVPGALIGPACGLASIGLVTLMNKARYDTLTAAVTDFDARLLEPMRDYLARELKEISRQRLIALEELIQSDVDAANERTQSWSARPGSASPTVRRLFENVSTARALLRTDAAKPAEKMATAHHTLREALANPDRQTAAVAQAMTEFVDAVAKLRDAFAQANG